MNLSRSLVLVAFVVLLTGCDERPLTYGDYNSIIAVTDTERWEEISELVFEQIERTIQTVRDEKTFTVTYQEPYGQYWSDLRRFRQMLLIGTMEDAWIQEAIRNGSVDVPGPGIHQIPAVWSRDQTVTMIVLPPDGSHAELPELLDRVYTIIDEQHRQGVVQRMYFSGVADALADTLQNDAGFQLLLPQVYRWMRQDSVFTFRNDNPDPSELIREITVTWRSPSSGALSAEQLIAWREGVADTYFAQEQDLVLEGMLVREDVFGDYPGLEIQAQWRNPPDGWPAGGPLLVRALTCAAQDRTYLVDAWLYAPGREKYEYMIQLETILDTFECGP